mmetsp:Transcript_48666/g.135005  ORF Transcript_48666/g.135005 Transcript_48666/m.135005 type:complete len:80 (-) Transcript_48666:537-776(-)
MGGGNSRPGDWYPKPVQTYNRAPMGGGMGGGGGGDVRPGDWTCPNCGANVFASKMSCFRCHTPKPEGLNGGFWPSLELR